MKRSSPIQNINSINALIHKINLELNKYEQTLQKVQTKIMTHGALKAMEAYINSSYQNMMK